MTCIVTNTAASAGGLTWLFIDFAYTGRLSIVGWCAGAVASLVAITPASGFVAPWAAIIIGIVGSATCYYATGLKAFLRVDDSLDIFAIHAIGGIMGNILTCEANLLL